MFRLKTRQFSIIINVIIFALFLVLTVVSVINRQYIIDQVVVWQFKSTSQLDNLVIRSGMNDYGMFLYHASQPMLEATQNFNSECARVELTTSILGCYTNGRIYVFDIQDETLDGIREVTATHEVLHAAYARLSDYDRQHVDRLLGVEYEKIKNDPDFAEKMAFYSRTEPGEIYNELHSIIGTEVSYIGKDLEDYYRKYFINRQQVVSLNAKYSNVFKNLEARVETVSRQLELLATSIQQQADKYNSDVMILNQDIIEFNSRASSGDFDSQAEFNNERNKLVSRVNSIDASRNEINNDIGEYDRLLNEYNSITIQTKKLYDTIDSTLAPAPSL